LRTVGFTLFTDPSFPFSYHSTQRLRFGGSLADIAHSTNLLTYSLTHYPSSPSSSSFPPLSFFLHSLPLEVGPLNTARRSGAEPQRKSNLVHFSLNSDTWWHQFHYFPDLTALRKKYKRYVTLHYVKQVSKCGYILVLQNGSSRLAKSAAFG